MKFYINNIEDLNEEEKKYNKISYGRLVKRVGDIWLFNNAPELSEYDFEFEIGSDYDEETEELKDIYQYYLIDCNNYILERLNDCNCKDLIIAWSEKLENYILLVDHYGTSWDYILTDFEPTTNFDEADI